MYYSTWLCWQDFFILSGASRGVSISSLVIVSSGPVGIANTSISLVFLISNGILKTFL